MRLLKCNVFLRPQAEARHSVLPQVCSWPSRSTSEEVEPTRVSTSIFKSWPSMTSYQLVLKHSSPFFPVHSGSFEEQTCPVPTIPELCTQIKLLSWTVAVLYFCKMFSHHVSSTKLSRASKDCAYFLWHFVLFGIVLCKHRIDTQVYSINTRIE